MTKIISEIGWNHMGDMDLAKKMILESKNAGADFAKFQTWRVKNLKSGPWDNDGRLEILERSATEFLNKFLTIELKKLSSSKVCCETLLPNFGLPIPKKVFFFLLLSFILLNNEERDTILLTANSSIMYRSAVIGIGKILIGILDISSLERKISFFPKKSSFATDVITLIDI